MSELVNEVSFLLGGALTEEDARDLTNEASILRLITAKLVPAADNVEDLVKMKRPEVDIESLTGVKLVFSLADDDGNVHSSEPLFIASSKSNDLNTLKAALRMEFLLFAGMPSFETVEEFTAAATGPNAIVDEGAHPVAWTATLTRQELRVLN